jgi:hypothetical protein
LAQLLGQFGISGIFLTFVPSCPTVVLLPVLDSAARSRRLSQAAGAPSALPSPCSPKVCSVALSSNRVKLVSACSV